MNTCSICGDAAKDAVISTQNKIKEIQNMNKKEFIELRRKMEKPQETNNWITGMAIEADQSEC